MRCLLIILLLIISSCYSTQQGIEQYIQDTYKKDYSESNRVKRPKILYSDTIRYDCGKTKVIHYYEEN